MTWSTSYCCVLKWPLSPEAPAAFAGIIYLVVRQKYFVGYMGQTSQRYNISHFIEYKCIYNHWSKTFYWTLYGSTPGYLFGKRILSFLLLMCIVGIFNYLLLRYLGNDYKEHVETITSAASALLLIP